ncbi:MAG: hypothetical protein EZS28_037665 [Streblomastix strix]|uniref:Uncharacterized protein n=1 Tax=Streblomastix strix TaxID=222440 RepID=A0A5J4U8W9_9EUKA|nr:MAG: hypothetical protein EZS28_037665 [Streblomastix strix]
MGKAQKGLEQTSHYWMQKRKRNKVAAAVVVVVVVVAVTATIKKEKKIGQGKGIRQFREPMEMRTGQRMKSAIDKWRKIDRLNLIRNNRLTNNNPNYNNHKWKEIQKSMKTKHKGVQNQKTSFHSHNRIRIIKTQTQITQVHNTIHLTNSLHHTHNNTQHHPHWKTHQIYQDQSLPEINENTKKKESQPKQPKLQQYAGLMGVIERFHEVMKPIIEEEKKKPDTMLPGQYKHYPYKDGPMFFYPPKNYRPTPIPRPKDLNLSEEQWEQFDGDVRQGVVPYLAGFINIYPQIYQSIPEAVIGLITFAAEQIIETEKEDKEQLTRELERIVADGTNDNEDNDQSEHAIEPKHVINGNDGLRKNDSGTQLQATVNKEANPEINITKTSANTPPHNVNGSDGLG